MKNTRAAISLFATAKSEHKEYKITVRMVVNLNPAILLTLLSSKKPVIGTVKSKSTAEIVNVRLNYKSGTPRSITSHWAK